MVQLNKPLAFIMALSIFNSCKYAWASRRVWWFTATARTKARFSRTFLGSFWLGLSNLLSIAILAIVYGTVFKVTDFNAYVLYLGTGLVLWNSLSMAIGSSPTLFEGNAQHIHNTNLHPIFYSLEEWAFQVQTFLQSLFLVLLALTYYEHRIFLNLITACWLPLFNFILFLYWLPLLVCLLGARFRDLYQLVPILMQLMFLLSPILFKKQALGALQWTADFNPIYRVLSILRNSLSSGQVLWQQSFVMLVINGIGLWVALVWLNRERGKLPFLI
mgnify:CR=1 FL=1